MNWFREQYKKNLKKIERDKTKDEEIKRLKEELLVVDEVFRICRALPTATKREIGILDLFEGDKE